jgi:hypothetical protein
MQVNNRPPTWLIGLGPVETVVDWQKMGSWQLVGPLHQHACAALCFQGRAGRRRADSPAARRLQIAMHPAFDLPHGQAIIRHLYGGVGRTGPRPRRPRHRGNRKRIDERGKFARVENRPGELLLLVTVLRGHETRGHQPGLPQVLPSRNGQFPESPLTTDGHRCTQMKTVLSACICVHLRLIPVLVLAYRIGSPLLGLRMRMLFFRIWVKLNI